MIDPEWERIVENHRRDKDATGRGRARERETRSTIWDYKQPQVKSEPEAAATRTEVSTEEKCSNGNGVFSFVPSVDSAPQPSSPEVIRVDSGSASESRQSRARAGGQGERRSRLAAFQQIWPQTYNSFQNRAVSASTPLQLLEFLFCSRTEKRQFFVLEVEPQKEVILCPCHAAHSQA